MVICLPAKAESTECWCSRAVGGRRLVRMQAVHAARLRRRNRVPRLTTPRRTRDAVHRTRRSSRARGRRTTRARCSIQRTVKVMKLSIHTITVNIGHTSRHTDTPRVARSDTASPSAIACPRRQSSRGRRRQPAPMQCSPQYDIVTCGVSVLVAMVVIVEISSSASEYALFNSFDESSSF